MAPSALLLAAAAVAVVAAAGWRASDPGVGVDLTGLFAALAAELPLTLPATVLVTGAMALNVAAGASVLRLVQQRPFGSWAQAGLAGLSASVLLDLALLSALGGLGQFRAVVLLPVLVAVALVGATQRPFCRQPLRLGGVPIARSALAIVAWSTVVLVGLASPVVPAADVLPNHVAPAEHLRAFGSIATLATYPSPIYGPSRLFLGYEALFGLLSTVTAVPASLAVAVSSLWLAVATVVAARMLAVAAFGRAAGNWAAIAMLPTFTFVRLVDVRDSVTALPIAALALVGLVGSRIQRQEGVPGANRPDWILAVALAATALVHPLVGTLTALTVVLATVGEPRAHARRSVPAILATGAALSPQLAIMIGLAPAPITAIVALAAAAGIAVAAAWILDRSEIAIAVPALAGAQRRRRLSIAVALGLGSAVLVLQPNAVGKAIAWVNPHFPLLFAAAAVALVGAISTARQGRVLTSAGLGSGLALLFAAALVPGDSLLGQSIRYEVPKAVGYWLPWVCVPALAGVLGTTSTLARRRPVWAVVAALVLAVILLPTGSMAANATQASQPTADVAVANLRTLQRGYFQGYPDARRVVGPTGSAVITYLEGEIRGGSLHPTDQLLHIAASHEPWSSIPVAVLTGVDETAVSNDAATTIFTAGGRIYPLSALAQELKGGFSWVLLEPVGLPTTIRDSVLAAGYESVFARDGAEVFAATASR